MSYEKPKMEPVVLEMMDIIRTSITDKPLGDGSGWTDEAPQK